MTNPIMLIEDRIRDENVRVALDVDVAIAVVVDGLVRAFGLPRRDFDLSAIEYQLVRVLDGCTLHPDATLRGADVSEGERLALVSPAGRRVWETVQRLLDEIEDEIRDQIKDEIRDRIADEVWDRITRKMSEIEKTLTGGDRVERVREWVAQHGGPGQLLDIAESLSDVASQSHPQTYSAASTMRPAKRPRVGLWLLIIGGGLVAVIIGGLILILLVGNFEPPEPPFEPPIGPVEPVEPINPIEPIEPIEPGEPVEPNNPIEPVEPGEPIQPIE
jgi:hypothetical protein